MERGIGKFLGVIKMNYYLTSGSGYMGVCSCQNSWKQTLNICMLY